MMNRNQTIEILGRIGEKIVANYFSQRGCKVIESINHFDSEKDMLIDDKKIEVKTQQPFVKLNSLTFRKNQLRKCKNVDKLFVVTVPPVMRTSYKWGGWILEIDPKTFKYTNYTTKVGTQMICINIEQEAVKPLYKLTTEEVVELMKYAQSDY